MIQPDITLNLIIEILKQNTNIINNISASPNIENYIRSDIYKGLCKIENILLTFLYQIVPIYPELENQVGDNLKIVYHNRVHFPWN